MKNVPMCYTGVTEGKIENLKKEGKMRIIIIIFIYTIHFAYMKVYTKFHYPKPGSCWENWGKISHMWYKGVIYGKIEKEGKMSFSIFIFIYTIHLAYLKVYTKCGCNFVTQYNSSLSSFVPNFRALSQVVAEKSLTEKKFTDRQTNSQTNKHNHRNGKNYTPPIYFVPGV